MDPIFYYPLLIITGLVAGFINTIGGGGSNLTMPALMVLGMPADIANATNRVAVTLQCLVGAIGFQRQGMTQHGDLPAILGVSTAGAGIGALLAILLPNLYLKPLLLGTMVLMALIILLRPAVIAPEPGTPVLKTLTAPRAWLGLLAAGIYGGFVQAGVGFILIATLSGALRYDLVGANAIKNLCILLLTLVALLIFIVAGKVQWVPGLVLAVGSMIGAHFSVRFALRVNHRTMRWSLFVMTVAAATAALLS